MAAVVRRDVWQTDRQTERQTDRQAGRQAGRQRAVALVGGRNGAAT